MNYVKKTKIFGIFIVLIFIGSTFISVGMKEPLPNKLDAGSKYLGEPTFEEEQVEVECSTYGIGAKNTEQKATLNQHDAEFLLDKINTYAKLIAADPQSTEATALQQEIITITSEYGLVPHDTLAQIKQIQLPQQRLPPKIYPNSLSKADEWFCNYAAGGEGGATPVIIFPRLTPILLFPIPRLFYRWNCRYGYSSVGGLRSGTGFYATGQQTGTALGFWGIGFSIFLPPVQAFGIIGYALHCSVEAEDLVLWPPNYPPDINPIFPLDGAVNIPISTTELSFYIDDYENELMSYSVTTKPDIGGDNANLKPDGTYTVPISGLEGTETYSWTVTVSDGPNTVEETYNFTTEPVAPIVENPTPEDGKRFVPITLPKLQCHLQDPQGDQMDYSIETSPDIGSDSGTVVGNGFVSLPISNLNHLTNYIWYVNVTDGVHWKHKSFSFQTEPIMVFNPFDEGWIYQKNITINHTMISGVLTNFPVPINIIDLDLQDKAQADGQDILFMDNLGIANRLYHEIEYFNDATGEIVVWVNVTSLNDTSDKMIHMYYGNNGCNTQEFPEVTWNNQIFEAIYHMANCSDSLGNHDGINNGVVFVNPSGALGFCGNFERDLSNYIEIPQEFELRNMDRTFSAWVNAESVVSDNSQNVLIALRKDMSGQMGVIGRDTTINHAYTLIVNNGNNPMAEESTDFNAGIWHHLTSIANFGDTDYLHIYKDGLQAGSVSGSWNEVDKNFKDLIGAFWHGSRDDINHWDGFIDELRIYNTALSDDWIETEYNSIKYAFDGGFFDVGQETTL